MTDERLAEIEAWPLSHQSVELLDEISRLKAEVEAMRPGAEAWEIVRRRKWTPRYFDAGWLVPQAYLGVRPPGVECFADPIAAVHDAEAWLKEKG